MKTPSIGIDQNQDQPFQDKYWGDCPKMVHSIPEADIYECNTSYMYLVNAVMEGEITQVKVHISLYREVTDFINNVIGASGGGATGEDLALYNCMDAAYGPYAGVPE